MTKVLKQKFKYLENEQSFQDEIKSIFYYHFKGLSSKQNKFFFFLEDESSTLNYILTSVEVRSSTEKNVYNCLTRLL